MPDAAGRAVHPLLNLDLWTTGLPSDALPERGMDPDDAYRAIDWEMALDGDPRRNLATFVTTSTAPSIRRPRRSSGGSCGSSPGSTTPRPASSRWARAAAARRRR
jgi:hypothetical protein